EDQADIHSMKAYDVGDIIVARFDHPCVGRRDVALEALIQFPWILPPPNNPFRSYLEGWFYHEGVPLPSNVFEIASMFAAREILLNDGQVVCALPSKGLGSDIEAGRLARLNDAIARNPPAVGMLHKRDAETERDAEEHVNALRETVGRTASAGPRLAGRRRS